MASPLREALDILGLSKRYSEKASERLKDATRRAKASNEEISELQRVIGTLEKKNQTLAAELRTAKAEIARLKQTGSPPPPKTT